MRKFNLILINCIIAVLCIFCSFFLFKKGLVVLSIIAIILFLCTSLIFSLKKAYPLRFMYPGLLTFTLFMLLPIAFTIIIAFTNLGTGHVLSKDAVYELLLSEKFSPEDSPSLSYKLSNSGKTYYIEAIDDDSESIFAASFKLGQKVVDLKKLKNSSNQTYLSAGNLFKLTDKLKETTFNYLSNVKLKIDGTRSLAVNSTLYKKLKNGDLLNLETNQVYHPDMKRGLFTDGEEDLSPGFFVNVGFSNFKKLVTGKKIKEQFLKIVIWTLIWAVGSVFLSFSLGIFLAIIVNNRALKLKSIYRILLIIPYSIPFFISVLVFRGMLNKDFGVINEVLSIITNTKIDWLGDPLMAKISCLLVNLWLGFPYMFLVTTGILQAIPESIYEAASLDGASKWATFRRITLPLVMSAVAPLLVGTFAFNLNNFVGIYLLTGGGPPMVESVTPAGETDILISYTYRLAFEGGQGQDFGLASSIAIIIFILIAILTIINFRLSGMFKERES